MYKPFSVFGRVTTPGLGDFRSPWLLTTCVSSWDDPPSGENLKTSCGKLPENLGQIPCQGCPWKLVTIVSKSIYSLFTSNLLGLHIIDLPSTMDIPVHFSFVANHRFFLFVVGLQGVYSLSKS